MKLCVVVNNVVIAQLLFLKFTTLTSIYYCIFLQYCIQVAFITFYFGPLSGLQGPTYGVKMPVNLLQVFQ